MKETLARIMEGGLEVRHVKVIVRCLRCEHEWAIRISLEEAMAGKFNPSWASCWLCRMGVPNQMGDYGGHS